MTSEKTNKTKVAIGLLGTTKDRRGKGTKRWSSWRPTVSIFQQKDLKLDRLELLHQPRDKNLATKVCEDVQEVSNHTAYNLHSVRFIDPWDFEEVYSVLLEFCQSYPFKPEKEDYYLHITTGTHVAQICWFLLCEANYIPARLLQSSPGVKDEEGNAIGTYSVIDLDLSKYDALAQRFQKEALDDQSFLKSGIQTKNKAFNQMIEQIEKVAVRSTAPMLITGPTGAGKSMLAKRIYQLKQQKGLVAGDFIAVNCATLKGDNAMSALFGHIKGAFTGAQNKRDGLLLAANQGLLFLDEIGELGLDEQAMLLHAIEEKTFYPLGSDKPVQSDFQQIAGTNKDLYQAVEEGVFRDDLLARINLWTYQLPGLAQRKEDIEPNLNYELQEHERKTAHKASFNQQAKQQYLAFATSSQASWRGNFRDLNASVQRMLTLAEGGRINEIIVSEEVERLSKHWQTDQPKVNHFGVDLAHYFSEEQLASIDLFDQLQLQQVISICQQQSSLSAAGRELFNYSRTQKASNNDSHRLRIYLSKFGLSFNQVRS
ncbi:RNA repair transcriptional activator RtcR [Spartinivicinus poritis]|uniref:RNA repair transcriptional activator RtcR n=1 Tax=Spartinivicinus poritis TaxID=2994640 RepID=A0ABT5U4Q6_9GAMM|nr:RNA repair transcriptional activator RtcR [Spartinivicinus sp. A2-2]MDE1461351.1 RNA repair transcriptional activator RtcR [Spartinivicinus sp. A2-2]